MVIMVSSQDWPQYSDTKSRDLLCVLPPVLLQRHVFPYLRPQDLMALYHTCRYLRCIIANWNGWKQLYRQDFDQDWVKSPSGTTPFEAYLLRSRAQVYILWLCPNKKPQIVGPTPAFAVRKVTSSRLFATILSSTGQLYAVEEKAAQPEQVGARRGRAPRPGDCKLGLSRMRHLDTRFSPHFVNVWGSHAFTHALTDKNELFLWYSSGMLGFKLSFPPDIQAQLGRDEIKQVASCSSNTWHVAHVGHRVLWWCCDYTSHQGDSYPVKRYELFAESIADMVVIGTRVLLLLKDSNTVLDLALGSDGIPPSRAAYSTFVVPEGCYRLGSCLSILSLFCRDGSTVVVDINYPETTLLHDSGNAIDIFVQPGSTWKLCLDGSVFHRSAYNWANSLLWAPAEITPLSIASPSSMVLDTTLRWTPGVSKTRQPIVLDPNAVENLSNTEATNSIFMHRVLQITHQFTPHSLNSLHLVLMESSLGDIFSGSTLHGVPLQKKRARVVQSPSVGWWRRALDYLLNKR